MSKVGSLPKSWPLPLGPRTRVYRDGGVLHVEVPRTPRARSS